MKVWPIFGFLSVPHVFSVFLPSWLFKTLKIPFKSGNMFFLQHFFFLGLMEFNSAYVQTGIYTKTQRSWIFEIVPLCSSFFQVHRLTNFCCLHFLNTDFSFFNSEKLLSLGFLSPHYSLQTVPRLIVRIIYLFPFIQGSVQHCLLSNDRQLLFSIVCLNF